jgi:hypothetical protein
MSPVILSAAKDLAPVLKGQHLFARVPVRAFGAGCPLAGSDN